ncbi:carbohydrate ABC transporter permease [Aquibacillus albus]|uniref:Raffinose/stachyose/melibiose transport system permease protein n=1 Tax=Aquibacillus albus TaxID=1168171 RepID=A0ABS2N541_9BACI|nr:carbohydrate ABC transporter permease [Aquibacillus albus]MBM7573000.1 raffinose/stachyose/melibiose transport system permease protein [Aquibacillus albus]
MNTTTVVDKQTKQTNPNLKKVKTSNGIKRTASLILNVFLFLLSATCLFPIIWVAYSSLKTQKEFSLNIISLPTQFHFQNFIDAIEITNMGTLLFNSTYVTVISVVLTLVLGFVTAYVLSRFTFKGRAIVYTLFLLGMLIPIHSLLIPIFALFNSVNIANKWYTLIFPNVAFNLPIVIFLIENFIRTIPKELEEAAYIDGSSMLKTMFYIILPICKPVLATALVLSFLHTWNEFPFALVLINDQNLRTIPVGLANFTSSFTVNYPQLMAALVIAILPVVIVYLVANKQIIKGMAAGAIKS